MVKFTTITKSNARFANNNSQNAGLVCVFAGATSGIGAGTIERMAVMVQSATFYVLGRSITRFASQRAKLESLNSNLKLVFLEAEISLISDIDAASKKIVDVESKVDYLYMSQGCFPINVPQCTSGFSRYINTLTCFVDTKEGLDFCLAIQYYSRIRLTTNLLPLLRKSSRPRILSVLNGGNEKQMCDEDIGLENLQNYSWSAAVNHIATMMTLSFEYLAENDKNITFLHGFPGLVRTEIFSRLTPAEDSGILGRFVFTIMKSLAWTMQWLLGMSVLDCGARQAFILTSDEYGPGEVWRVNEKSEAVTVTGVLERYREQGWREKVWNYTSGVIEKALATSQ
jgi:NAD(P)-dependent dehydrogenase (short-subunit alcohol dehydrogenase family)